MKRANIEGLIRGVESYINMCKIHLIQKYVVGEILKGSLISKRIYDFIMINSQLPKYSLISCRFKVPPLFYNVDFEECEEKS